LSWEMGFFLNPSNLCNIALLYQISKFKLFKNGSWISVSDYWDVFWLLVWTDFLLYVQLLLGQRSKFWNFNFQSAIWAKISFSFEVMDEFEARNFRVRSIDLVWFLIAPRSSNKALKFNSPHALSTHCNPTPKTLSFQNFRDSSPTHLSRFLLHTKFLENRLELEFGLSPFRVFVSVFSKSLMLSIVEFRLM
jgi:hypothetical protein